MPAAAREVFELGECNKNRCRRIQRIGRHGFVIILSAVAVLTFGAALVTLRRREW